MWMPSRPARPAASHTSRDTTPSRSHCSWYGAISFAMKARTMSRNSSWSWVKISRCIASASTGIVPEVLRSVSFESTVSGMSDETGKGIEPGMPGNPVRLTDPKMMRALAHPARIAIWSHIGLRGSVTATECAEVAGLSPSACSYHLRTLAKYGFIEEDRAAAADGRERPWRVRLLAFTLVDQPDSSAGKRMASRLLVENLRASAEEGRTRYLDRQYEYPGGGRGGGG